MHSLPGHKHAWDMEVRNRRVRVECLESWHVVRECLGDRFFLSCHSHHLLLVKPNNRLSGLLSCNWLRVLPLALTFCTLCSNALPQGTLALQRHFSVATKFCHDESWCCGRQ